MTNPWRVVGFLLHAKGKVIGMANEDQVAPSSDALKLIAEARVEMGKFIARLMTTFNGG